MSDETPEGTISVDEAVERMMVKEPTDDDAAEVEEPEETGEADNSEEDATEVEPDEDDDEDNPDEEPSIEIDTESGKKRLTAAQVKESLLLRADYTRKTQEIAEKQRAFEARMADISQKEQQLSEALQTWAVPTQQEPDWERLATELPPDRFVQEQAKWMKRQKQAEQARSEWINLQQAQQEQNVAAEREKLFDAVPEWRDEAKFEADAREMVGVAGKYGFTPNELANIADHRILRVLRDVSSYDKLKQAKPASEKKVSKAPVSLKPGSKPNRSESKDAARQSKLAELKKTGSVDAAIDLLFMG